MKIIITLFAAAAVVFGAGCTAELANRKLGPEEQEWKEYLESMYPGWEVPGTLPPAISDRYQNYTSVDMTNDNFDDNLSLNDNTSNSNDVSLAADASSQNIKVRYEDYVVEKDDTLSHIAKKVYGNGRKYYRIYKANEDIIKNANRIYPGMTIKIPRP